MAAISENHTPFVLSQAPLHSAGKSASTYLVYLPVYVRVYVYENQRVLTLQISLSMFVCVCERERVKETKREREREVVRERENINTVAFEINSLETSIFF